MQVRIRHHATPTGQARRACRRCRGRARSPVAVSAFDHGPQSANTTYHFRISATNAGGTSKGADEMFKTLPNPPTVATEAASTVTQTTATPERDREPQRRGSERMQLRIRPHELLWINRAMRSAPGCGSLPVAVTAPLTGLTANTDLPLQDLGDQRRGHEQRRDQTFTTPASPATVVTEPASADHADLGDAQRDGQPQRRRSQRMQVRIRHHQRLRVKRAVHDVTRVG